ncbi:hypothetical protein FJZ21_03115 [Candidatus Pacearchaeota archaeon]|nr:hypothetical protein [Candidatus Pacearchaeota archaeon]
MVNWTGLKTIDEHDSKIVSMDWSAVKKFMLFFVLFIFVVIFLVFSITDTAKINGKKVTFNSFEEKLPILSYIFIGFVFLNIIGLLFYYPLRIVIKKDRNGNLSINKRDWFFVNKNYNLNKTQNPVFIARKRRMVGATIFVGRPVYQPIIKYYEGEKAEEINLIFTASYFMRGIGPRGVIQKEQAQEISKFLGIKLIVEE